MALGFPPRSPRRNWLKWGLLGVAVAGALGVLLLAQWDDGLAAWQTDKAPSGSVALAVVGDSNSQSFQDSVSFPPGSAERGGALRAHTFQWTEVLARLRGQELDSGPWVTWGRPGEVAWLRELIGLPGGRAPLKQDYLYNFANAGATCKNLMGEFTDSRFRQVPRLVNLMDRDPDRWRNGVVIIRISTNDMNIGVTDEASRNPDSPAVKRVVQNCLDDIGEAVALIHRHHPSTRIVLVGAFDYSNHAVNLEKWQSRTALDNIAKMADSFDDALQKMVAATPNTSFFSDRQWFRGFLGTRDADGKPAFRTLHIGPTLQVVHSLGDSPDHSMLADFHNGLVWNTVWAQAMAKHLHDVVKVPVTPISDEEVVRFIRSQTDAPSGASVRATGS